MNSLDISVLSLLILCFVFILRHVYLAYRQRQYYKRLRRPCRRR